MSLKKLTIEIDKCLKKVTEGLQHFDQIYDKILNVTNQSQRDKLEQDLKKEIKKLQRNRDQIKMYLQKDEIKDKRHLEDNKKLIETQMERFKAMERELKLKAFSKEGLAQHTVDPKEKEKQDASDWISEQLQQFENNVEKFEYELEQLDQKKKNKDKDKMEELEYFIERHKFHTTQLEIILRMLENDKIEPQEIEDIKDSIEYYLENYEDDDGMDEEIYNDFHLDEQDQAYGIKEKIVDVPKPPPPAPTPKPVPPKKPVVKEPEPEPPIVSPPKKDFVEVIKEERPLPGQVPTNTSNTPVLNFRAAIKQASLSSPATGHQSPPGTLPDVNVPQGFEDLLAAFHYVKNTAFSRPVEEQGKLFETSLKHIPSSHDIIPTQPYFPKDPYPVPPIFPQMPLALFDNPVTFSKLPVETLFFAFYAQQKTLQQYLAARELKKQSWRFHTQDRLWYQRHAEPREISDAHEVGNYMTFDYSTWTMKQKNNFVFEYKYLEDTDMP